MFRRLRGLVLVAFLLLCGGCANLVSGVTSQLADDLRVAYLIAKTSTQ